MKKGQTQAIITKPWNFKPSSVEVTPQSEQRLRYAGGLVTDAKISEAP